MNAISQKILKIAGLLMVSFFIFSEPVDAVKFENGQCQTFAKEGKRLEIFSLTQEEDYTTEAALMSANVFCVEVGSASTTVLWVDLRENNEEFKKHPNWQYQNVVREEHQYDDDCEIEFNVTDWSTTQNYTQPAAIIYKLVNTPIIDCDVGGDEGMRQRYRFNVRPDIGTELYLYYMRPAGPTEQLSNPITTCANHNTSESACKADNKCYWLGSSCKAKADTSVKCADIPPAICTTNVALHCKIGNDNKCVDRIIQISQSQAIEKFISSTYGMPEGYEGPLPECAFTGSCRSIEDLIGLGVKVANWLFSVIAGLAFVFFVYGGITMIMSFGNSEKVGQGKQILVAATIGLIITFSAYILVGFVVKAIGILPGYSLF